MAKPRAGARIRKPRQTPWSRLSAAVLGSGPASDSGFWPLMSVLLAFVIIISWCQIRSLDLFWHLQTGAWIWQHGSIPKADPFSYSAAGKPWISHEWLFGLLSYLAYRLGGLPLVVGGKALLIGLLFAISALAARARGARPGMIFLVLAAGYVIVRLRLTERPELLSLPLAAGFLLVYEKSRIRPYLILVLPLLQLLWVNSHGGTALLGWLLAGSFLVDRVCAVGEDRRIGWRGLILSRHLLPAEVAMGGVILLSFANPHFDRALLYGLLRAESPLDNKEFQSLFRLMSLGIDLFMILFILFAALLLLALVLRPRTLRVYEMILFPLLLMLALTYFRFRTPFVFLLAPALAQQLSTGKWLDRLCWWLPSVAGLVLMIYTIGVERENLTGRFGPGLQSGLFPEGGVEFIKRCGLTGRMYNSYGFGGYLIWQLWPGQKVFIDGREDVYVKPGVLEDYIHGLDSSARWQALTEKYEFDFAILGYPELAPAAEALSLETIAFPRNRWGLVYFDDVCVIYARRKEQNASILRSYEIRSVQPLQLSSYLDPIIRDPQRFPMLLAELAANRQEHPSSYRNSFAMGIIQVKRGPGFLDSAAAEFQRTIDLNPSYVPAYINLARVYAYQNRIPQAAALLRKASLLENNASVDQELKRLQGKR